ncbi:MAG: hypothetical protein ACRD0J_06370, partial [Acidimicrobiales bacterium]
MKSRGRARNKSPSGPAGLPGQLTHQGTGPSAGADRDGPVRRRPRVDQTPLTLLGLALAALLGLAWLTGLAYLVVRGGLPAPVRLPVVDLVHVYVGIGVVGLLVAKARKVGWRLSVPGEPDMAPRRRWLSWSLVALYGAVGVTGALALVPLPGGASAALVDGHLIAAVWATAPTTVHLLGYSRRAGAMLRRRSRARARRLALGLAVAVVPLVAVAALPGLGRAASPLARQGGGGSW